MTKKIITIFVLLIALQSCDILKQISEMTNLSKCEFKLHSVKNLQIANVDIQGIKSFRDINFLDAAKITAAIASNNLPMSFNLNVKVKNPNESAASMNKMDWILYVDDRQITQGILNQKFSVASNGGETIVPLSLNFNLKEVLKGETSDALLNFVFNLAKKGSDPSTILLKIKPTVFVGNQAISYPGYINVRKEFTSK